MQVTEYCQYQECVATAGPCAGPLSCSSRQVEVLAPQEREHVAVLARVVPLAVASPGTKRQAAQAFGAVTASNRPAFRSLNALVEPVVALCC